MFQYHISVVPTTYIDGTRILAPRILTTSQFAVTDYAKTVATGGIPGIFFKYDIEALSVRIVESRQSFLHFITRFCGIIGGEGVFINNDMTQSGLIINYLQELL